MPMYLSGYKRLQVTPWQLRQDLHLSNTRMAQLLGVSADTWLAWQAGRRQPFAAASRLMDLLLWLHKGGRLFEYWLECAEPKIKRSKGYEDAIPDRFRRNE